MWVSFVHFDCNDNLFNRFHMTTTKTKAHHLTGEEEDEKLNDTWQLLLLTLLLQSKQPFIGTSPQKQTNKNKICFRSNVNKEFKGNAFNINSYRRQHQVAAAAAAAATLVFVSNREYFVVKMFTNTRPRIYYSLATQLFDYDQTPFHFIHFGYVRLLLLEKHCV